MTEITDRLSTALADRYRLERELGSGGMATVYLAHDVKHDRKVAVKVLRPELAAVLGAKRFVQEIKTTANLQHSHILPLFDSGEADSFLYYVMPFIDGESLRDRLDREKQLSIDEAVRIASEVADALHYAHERNVIHRDIKPENIMLRDEQVLVMDFGIAMALGSMDGARLTATGALIGTPQYMSPEQAAGESVGAASDVYALGSVLYEMLCGAAPHGGANIQAIIVSVLSREPELIRSVRSEVPPHVEQAISRALAMDPTDRFGSMSEFARALATSGSAPRSISGPRSSEPALTDSERRYATVVHSTLTGYAVLVEHLHPDDLEQLLERIQATTQEIVEQHGGVLNSASDEESVAIFGVPVAHEDDALRAVRAAREIQQFLGDLNSELQGESKLGVRTGIGTGFVVVRRGRRDGERFSIAGGAVSVAAGLAAHAADGDVLVSAESERLLVPFFSTEPLKPVTLGGESGITPHRIVGESGARTRLEAAERAGLTRFAGRDAEIHTLQECLKKSVAGAGQVISIVGEAGVGKSRLRYEFLHPLDPADVRVIEGRCQSIAETTPYLPFIETLRQVLNPASDVELKEGTVTASVRALDPGLENYISLYLHVLSVPSDEHAPPKHLKGKEFRRAMLDGLSAVFALASKQRPLVMMLEDWHQADEASQEMLKHLAGIATMYPLMIVVTARPQVIPDVGEVDHHTMMRLGPLEATASLAIICSVLDVDEVADDLGRHLHERTAGNPFFLEEICHTMQEENLLRVEAGRADLIGNVESLQLPDTVQAVLRSRLDRVDPDAREVLRLASVVGREFARDILERAVPDASALPASLETLTALGMIQQISVVPEPVYRFKHALTQEAAYESLVQHQRKTLHGLVGKVLEEHYADRAAEQPDIFAHHFSRAEQWPAAVRYGRRAAEKAHDLSQFANESRMLENALGWVRKLDESDARRATEIEVLLAWERTCETIGDLEQQQTIIENLMLLTEPDGYDRQRAVTYIRQGDLWTLLRHFDKAQDALTQSLEIWRTLSDRAGERNALRSLGFLGWHQGDLERGVTAAEAALAIDRELADLEAVALGLNNLGMVLKAAGRNEEALRYFEEAVQLFEDKQVEEAAHHALINAASIYRDRGEIDKAMRYLEKGHDVERRHHLTERESFTLTAMATIAQMQGRPDESIRIYEDLIRRTRDMHYATGLAQGLHGLSELLVTLGRRRDALPYVREKVEIFERTGERALEVEGRQRLAEIYEEELHDYAAATKQWHKVRALRSGSDDVSGELDAVESLARLARLDGSDANAVISCHQDVLELACKLDDVGKQGDMLNTLGILHWQQKDYAQSLSCYERALEIFRERADQVHVGLVLNSIGAVLRDSGRIEDAMDPLRKALDTNRQSGQRRLESHSLATLGDVSVAIGEPGQALVQYEASLELRRTLGDRSGEGWMLFRVAQVEAGEGRGDRALDLVSQARRIAEECGDAKLATACEEL